MQTKNLTSIPLNTLEVIQSIHLHGKKKNTWEVILTIISNSTDFLYHQFSSNIHTCVKISGFEPNGKKLRA